MEVKFKHMKKGWKNSDILGKYYYKSPFETKKMEWPSSKKKLRHFSFINMFHLKIKIDNWPIFNHVI